MRPARGTAGNTGGGEEVPRGRTGWWPTAVLVALAALVLLPVLIVLVSFVASDSEYPLGGGPEQRPCAEALGFGGAALPDGAEPVGACTMQGWQDVHYSAAFRMPRAGVAEWLAHTYPDAPAPRRSSAETPPWTCVWIWTTRRACRTVRTPTPSR
ncbi:hypothetical protein ID867_03070 [Streptomyces parvulus]|nr:hypothetical protein [Streptomyces parvulus]